MALIGKLWVPPNQDFIGIIGKNHGMVTMIINVAGMAPKIP